MTTQEDLKIQIKSAKQVISTMENREKLLRQNLKDLRFIIKEKERYLRGLTILLQEEINKSNEGDSDE